MNENLTNENISVRSELGKQQNKYEELNKEKENLSQTVAQASILGTSNAIATGVFFKSNGKEIYGERRYYFRRIGQSSL